MELMEQTPDDRRAGCETCSATTRSPPDRRPDDQPPARLRAGEPDPADVPRSASGLSTRGARARAPVVRRLGRRCTAGATSGSTRASPRFMEAAYARGARRPDDAGVARADVGGVRPQDDPFWKLPIGDPGPEQHLRLAGLHARLDDAPGAAAPDRRDGVLDASCGPGSPTARAATARPRSSRRWPSRSSGEDLDGFFTAWLVDAATRPAQHRRQRLLSRRTRRPDVGTQRPAQPRSRTFSTIRAFSHAVSDHTSTHDQADEPGVRLGAGADRSADGHGGVEAHPQRDGGERQGEQDERDVPDAAVGQGAQGGEQGDHGDVRLAGRGQPDHRQRHRGGGGPVVHAPHDDASAQPAGVLASDTC